MHPLVDRIGILAMLFVLFKGLLWESGTVRRAVVPADYMAVEVANSLNVEAEGAVSWAVFCLRAYWKLGDG